METKELSHEIADNGLDSDGLLSWEEFYGESNENLVDSILEMYDLLIGRSSEIKEDIINSQNQIGFEKSQESIKSKESGDETKLNVKKNKSENWCDTLEENWNCRCSEKSAIEPITRCSACNLKKFQIRSTDIRESQISKSETLKSINSNCHSEPSLSLCEDQTLSKCQLVTCPAGFSTPSTPVQQRFRRLVNQLPLSFKRNENYFSWVPRPSSVSSLASSSSSSSSGVSSYCGTKRLETPNKSSVHLASIESLEGDSDTEDQKDKSSRLSEETGGSKDSGVHSFCTSVPPDKPKYCDPHLSYMDKVVTEIIETEEVYVRDLRNIIEGYLMKWRSLPDFPLSDRLDILFGNIETVFSFNSLFLKDLKQCGLDPVKIAQCFVKSNAGFSVYTEYCTNYPKTVSLLTELMRQEGTVRLFRERQAALQHTLPLGSYLLKPVQRILKYHLLLQNIVKQYSNGIEGYKDIVDALRTMTEIAQHINDMKRRHEHEVRVQEIQSLLLGWEGDDLTTFGELCAEGTFRVYGAKALRHVFLFDKMLLITKKKEGGILGYKTHINCSNLMLIESVPGEPLSFHVIPFDNPRSQYTLQCRNLEQKREWTCQIKRVILENYNAVIPSHARQLVMELGQSKSEEDFQSNKILLKRHHLAPEYLEKRKQERGKTDVSFKARIRKKKKRESGNKLEYQFDKLTTSEEFSQLELHSNTTENETEDVQTSEEKKPKSDLPEKLELKTLEHIVTQILRQNKEFDQILKRQKQILSRSRDLAFTRKKKKEAANSRTSKGVYNTFKNLKFLKNTTNETPKEADWRFSSDSSSIKNEHTETDGNDFRRSVSFEEEEQSKEILDNFQKISEEDSIPTSPSVWLRQQVHDLPIAPKKAGSLPRSFQITLEPSQNNSLLSRDFKASIERPFTIASDKITSTMLFDGMERFYRGQFFRTNSSVTENESLTDELRTPGASLDHLNIHPEYKIYRSGLSANILKNLLSSVHGKLANIKADARQKSEPQKKVLTQERKASRVIYTLAKHYHKTLRNKQKEKNLENDSDSGGELVLSPVYKQGSASLGARLANFTESEFLINKLKCSKKAAALLGVYTESILSLQPTPKSSPSRNVTFSDQEINTKNQINSAECFYEKMFEEMDEEQSKLSREQDQRPDEKTTFSEETTSSLNGNLNRDFINENPSEKHADLMDENTEVQKQQEEDNNFNASSVEVTQKEQN